MAVELGGYDYGEVSDNVTNTPVAPAPAGMANRPIPRVHWTLPAPTLVDGRPQAWEPTEVPAEDWGTIRVKVDGVDVTWVRDVATVVGDTQHTDPYGPNNAFLLFPTISLYDAEVPSAEFPWLREGAVVRVDRVVDGVVVNRDDPPFKGIVDSIEQGEVTQVTCSGWFNGEASTMAHQPTVVDYGAKDVADILMRHIREGRHWRLEVPVDGTGMELNWRGSRDMTTIGAVDDVLARAITLGGGSWTILPDPTVSGKALRLQKRSMASVAYTVHAGAYGVVVQPRKDRIDKLTAVFGEFMTPDGERVRNAKYPNLGYEAPPPFPHSAPLELGMTDADTDSGDGITTLVREMWGNGDLAADDKETHEFTAEVEDAVNDVRRGLGRAETGKVDEALWDNIFGSGYDQQSFRQAHFEPFARATETEYYLHSPDGAIVGLNPKYDREAIRNEVFQGMGDHTTKRQARRYSRSLLARNAAVNFTIVLTSDPAECSRLDIRPGKVINVKHLFGSGLAGVDAYISSTQTSWNDPKKRVTLACSTTARHYLDLAAAKSRRMEARQDPAARWMHQMRHSNTVADAVQGWEGESGAGIIRARNLTGNTWNEHRFVAAQFGTIGDFRLRTTNAQTPFMFLLSPLPNLVNRLNNRVGNPFDWHNAEEKIDKFTHHADWFDDLLVIDAWGTPDLPGGYEPGKKTSPKGNPTGDAVSGRFRDRGTWTFGSRSGFLYLYAFPLAGCKLTGRARVVPSDGL